MFNCTRYSNVEEGTPNVVIQSDAASVDALYAALSKTNQEPVVREFLEAIRPCQTSSET